MQEESFLEKKERLNQQGKVELPMNIDDKKYLIGNLAFKDIAILLPAILLTVAIVYLYYTIAGTINQVIIIISFAPTALMMVLQMTKHPERKNIPLWQYKILWKIRYNNREKNFYYSKGTFDMKKTKESVGDTREKLPIKNVANGCIETKGNKLVKIIEVSSINLSLMNNADRRSVFESYQSFINELELNDLDEKEIQISQIAQPINLDSYAAWVMETARDDKPALRKLKDAYLKQIDDVQKNKSMVTRKRYLILSVPDKNNALDNIEMKSNHIQFKLENMLSGYEKLQAKILKNDELIQLIYSCIDFENAQSQGSGIVSKANAQSQIVLGEQTKELLNKAIQEHAATTFK